MNPVRRRLTHGLVAALLLFVAVQPALACVHRPPTPPNVWVIYHSPTFVWIIIHNYRTALVGPGQFCACGLKAVGPLRNITQLVVTNPATGQPLAGFGFQPNSNVASQFAAAEAATGGTSGRWGGFLSPISAVIPSGTAVDLMYGVAVPAGTTFNQIAAALSSQGLIANDEAKSNGTLLIDHLELTRPGKVTLASQDHQPVPDANGRDTLMPKPRNQ
jgi:hypothetical protein